MIELQDYERYYTPKKWLSISSLVSASRCPRKFFYSSGCRLSNPEPSPALTFGEALHSAFAPNILGHHDEALANFDKIWNPTLDDTKRSRNRAIYMLSDQSRVHKAGSLYDLVKPPQGMVELPDSISPYEVPFALDLGLWIPLVGRIDALGRHKDTGDLWGIEFKSSSELSGRFFDSFSINTQVIGYTLALRTLLGEKVRGVIVEALRVSPKNVETQMLPVHVDDHQVESFVDWAKWLGEQIQAWEEARTFPKNLSACTPYQQYGTPGWKCQFHGLCSLPSWTTGLQGFEKSQDRPFDKVLQAAQTGVPS